MGVQQGEDAAAPSASPLIEARLAQPRIRAGVVSRARLHGMLDRLDDVELIVLSGPAGSGKTVLVSSWLAGRPDLSPAWVSLDAADDEDPVRLWTYIAHAVDRVRPGIARPALARLRTPRSRFETAIDELLNGLSGYDGRIVIVLDDLHHVRSERGIRSLIHAVEGLPPTTRMVATTRSDPGRRMGRLRTRGALAELRATDLAFTVLEARELLVDRAGVKVELGDVQLLVNRTEGWAAGISLAALWLAGTTAPHAGIQEFSADHRHVADYLTSEVLDVLDDKTRDFMLRTSIFDRFNAELCDAVLGSDDAASVLTGLERSNLFLIALDAHGTWYRYHHLFRELLSIELASTSPGVATELHRRAAAWFLTQGLVEEALEQTAALDDHAELARLLAAEHLTLVRQGKIDVLMRWLDRLPDETLERAPVLAAAGGLMAGELGQPTSKRKRLTALAEASFHDVADARMRRYVETVIELTRAALFDSDLDALARHATRAVELAETDPDQLITVPSLAALAYTHYLQGDSASAGRIAEATIARPDAPRRPQGFVYTEALLALLESDAGRPRSAEARARNAVALARELGLSAISSSALAHHALGEALLAQGNARDAERELERAETLRRAPEPRLDHTHTLLALVAARIARGRLALAASELAAAREQLDFFSDVGRLGPLAASVAQLLEQAGADLDKTVEQLSLAELQVARLLATDLSQREIAGELFVSINTVKTHTRNLYAKLGVNSREEAIRRINELELLESGDSPG
jgi:LuxR family transcriptional regulator, maltose regulon positive regulatory protein